MGWNDTVVQVKDKLGWKCVSVVLVEKRFVPVMFKFDPPAAFVRDAFGYTIFLIPSQFYTVQYVGLGDARPSMYGQLDRLSFSPYVSCDEGYHDIKIYRERGVTISDREPPLIHMVYCCSCGKIFTKINCDVDGNNMRYWSRPWVEYWEFLKKEKP